VARKAIGPPPDPDRRAATLSKGGGSVLCLEIIVPFFEKHQLKTKKGINFRKFREVLLMMQKGEHLTEEGIERIRKVSSEMNREAVRLES